MPKTLDIDKELGIESKVVGKYNYVQGYKKGGAENYYSDNEKLKYKPEKQGKFLRGKLKGYLSIRAVGQRYRIIYQVQKSEIVGIGLRSEGNKQDIYSRLKKLL